MNTIMAGEPPSDMKEALLAAAGSAMPSATTIRMGISSEAVAELEMKLDRK